MWDLQGNEMLDDQLPLAQAGLITHTLGSDVVEEECFTLVSNPSVGVGEGSKTGWKGLACLPEATVERTLKYLWPTVTRPALSAVIYRYDQRARIRIRLISGKIERVLSVTAVLETLATEKLVEANPHNPGWQTNARQLVSEWKAAFSEERIHKACEIPGPPVRAKFAPKGEAETWVDRWKEAHVELAGTIPTVACAQRSIEAIDRKVGAFLHWRDGEPTVTNVDIPQSRVDAAWERAATLMQRTTSLRRYYAEITGLEGTGGLGV